jgi:hypothetical protein
MTEAAITRPQFDALLDRPIRDLGLKLEQSPVERFVQQLYRELERKRLYKFRPAVYLTDEWGCPSGEPVIGIPFYLAHPDLSQLESEVNDLEDSREIMMYLRHEAGHAFNYAYTDLNGNNSSDHSGGLIGTTIDLCLSRVSTSVTWPDGMRRSIPTKISQKLLRYG